MPVMALTASTPGTERCGPVDPSVARGWPPGHVFVQSTSYNRKLIGGTKFLYEKCE